jgi:Zn-dependent metalloprotease
VSPEGALEAAQRLIAEHYQVNPAELDSPRLEILNRGLFEGISTPTRLAWYLEGRAPLLRALVWIDAQTGAVLFHVNQLPDALDRAIHDGMSTANLPGVLVRSEGEPSTGDSDVDRVYDYSGDTYEYFLAEHGRDSYDGAGATMTATVRSCPGFCGCPCLNAYWIGTQTLFGSGFLTDDIVGHEWTHGVTDFTARLIYYKQSGALNESYSDIFGETVDLLNGTGNDTPLARWIIGEDLVPLRAMQDPTLTGDPGKMSDPHVACSDDDSGGVHTNSGIGNHAFVLMVDGGTYNGYTIAGIGLTKAGKIH